MPRHRAEAYLNPKTDNFSLSEYTIDKEDPNQEDPNQETNPTDILPTTGWKFPTSNVGNLREKIKKIFFHNNNTIHQSTLFSLTVIFSKVRNFQLCL